jgi:hypothetical protein
MTLVTLGLSGGVALADPHGEAHREVVRDHRGAQAQDVRYHDHDREAPPAVRFERHEERRGFRWVGGAWRWHGNERSWTPGYYVRIRL